MALSDIVFSPGECMISELPVGTLNVPNDIVFDRTPICHEISTSSVFPAAGDVDSGIDYGPNGDDFTGTLVQPAVSDVRDGTFYGADGTEFEGTLEVSGGGYPPPTPRPRFGGGIG